MPQLPSWGLAQLDLQPFEQGTEWMTPPARQIVTQDGTRIIAQVTVSEDLDSDLEITSHPVEQGTTIQDHAFLRPAEVRVQLGWSAAYLAAEGYSGTGVDMVRQIYEQIAVLQASRLPCQIFTAKRQYNNMLVASLRTHTDSALEWTFMADVTFREVVLVNTSVIAVAGQMLNPGAMADIQLIPVIPGGQVQTIQATVQNAPPQ